MTDSAITFGYDSQPSLALARFVASQVAQDHLREPKIQDPDASAASTTTYTKNPSFVDPNDRHHADSGVPNELHHTLQPAALSLERANSYGYTTS